MHAAYHKLPYSQRSFYKDSFALGRLFFTLLLMCLCSVPIQAHTVHSQSSAKNSSSASKGEQQQNNTSNNHLYADKPPSHLLQTVKNCQHQRDLIIVAHPDDDLLFMNPDIQQTIQEKGCILTVYLTAAERGEGIDYMLGREAGVRAAYANMAKSANLWHQNYVSIGHKTLAHHVLQANPKISLLFIRLQDQWFNKGWGSLTPLSQLESIPGQKASSLPPFVEQYNRQDLLNTLVMIMQNYLPTSIRYMDNSITIPYTKLCWKCKGHDHPDHIAGAKLVHEALNRLPGNYASYSYINYPLLEYPNNLSTVQIKEKSETFNEYARFDHHYCEIPKICKEPKGTAFDWVQRSYFAPRQSDTVHPIYDPVNHKTILMVRGELNNAINVSDLTSAHWQSIGGRSGADIQAFTQHNGLTAVIALDGNSNLKISSLNPKGEWQKWKSLPFKATRIPAIQKNPAGIHMLALNNDGWFYTSQAPFTQFHRLPKLANPTPHYTLVSLNHSRLGLIAQTSHGEVWLCQQKTAHHWSDWQRINPIKSAGGIAAIVEKGKTIQLYYRNHLDSHLYSITGTPIQPKKNSDNRTWQWSEPLDLGLPYINQPALLSMADSPNPVVAVTTSQHELIVINNARYEVFDGKFTDTPTLFTEHGQIYLLARQFNPDNHQQIYHLFVDKQGVWQTLKVLSALPIRGGTPF